MSREDIVLANISDWYKLNADIRAMPVSIDVFGTDWLRTLPAHPETDPMVNVQAIIRLAVSQGLSPAVLEAIWFWKRLPFIVRQAGLGSIQPMMEHEMNESQLTSCAEDYQSELVHSLDEWIPRNETYLRFLSQKRHLHYRLRNITWSYGLVKLEHLPYVLTESFDSSPTHIKISRPTSLPGFSVLGEKRRKELFVQSSQTTFDDCWIAMTGGVLRGLDWSNIFVAGGSVLGTFLCPPVTEQGVHTLEDWTSSDVDIFLWGVSSDEAVEKIKHVAQVYRANLPSGRPFLVVRNSQTITFHSSWPIKRIQIVLKLLQSPSDVLLNCDLDQCAIGYDGTNVWMLPRCVRAIETGYTRFTMDLINGHSLGNRKATGRDRVFKYADKGFGIRFPQPDSDESPSLDEIAATSRQYTSRCIEHYRSLEYLKKAERCSDDAELNALIPTISYAHLCGLAVAKRPETGCLSCFALFMRHVSLWEEQMKGSVRISDSVDVQLELTEDEASFYQDTAQYVSSNEFSVTKLVELIDRCNHKAIASVKESMDHIFRYPTISRREVEAVRIIYGSEIDEVLSQNLYIPFVASRTFVNLANHLILETLQDRGIWYKCGLPVDIIHEGDGFTSPDLCVAIWKLDITLNCEMVDRRIDEVRDALWDASIDLYRGVYSGRNSGARRHFMYTQTFSDWVSKSPSQL
ncbi:hypothetical protein V5O48_005818 [Marasmius crinis-equi]|uniref:Uncharacterized protein n=1 Tax=Marasmius crinis-equi TaxID=585013 RepID=A0ABR3FL70_9AGAR